MTLRAACLALLTTVPAFAGGKNEVVGTAQVDDGFADFEVVWDREIGTSYVYKHDLIHKDGMLIFCGAGYFTSPFSKRQTLDLLRKAVVTVGDEVILQDFTFFAKVKRKGDLDSATANCAMTTMKAPKKSIQYTVSHSHRARF